ncbi:AMIN-like domain-containing (lipo)protein [Cellulomonas triticagri]|uniref:AMIN-like domain-containing protein n=1 Tax=Cellulomonas triticagri TaxID=2483352 RepID=A0A3M2JGL0_9CELL|nr:hypothetical protein [Cellulomonas triticagri]RMI12962.1 hypothetical protein EBM89_06385 [Cellulomonas triticagri]
MPRTTPTRPTRLLLVGAAAGALALVAACGTGDAPDTSGSADPGSTVTAGPEPSAAPTPTPTGDADEDAAADAAAPAFPADTAPDTAEPSADAALTVTDVRVGHHDGYDRVVLELGGTGTPGWRVEYVDAAVEDPSGEPVDLTGDQALQVVLTGARYPFETGQTEFALKQPVTAAGTTVVSEAVLLGTFEAQSQAYVGVTGERAPFRAFLLQDPVRVVVDVQG